MANATTKTYIVTTSDGTELRTHKTTRDLQWAVVVKWTEREAWRISSMHGRLTSAEIAALQLSNLPSKPDDVDILRVKVWEPAESAADLLDESAEGDAIDAMIRSAEKTIEQAKGLVSDLLDEKIALVAMLRSAGKILEKDPSPEAIHVAGGIRDLLARVTN